METKLISSLIKVFADEELNAPQYERSSMLRNEVYSFQVAYTSHIMTTSALKWIRFRIESALMPWIRVYRVDLVPSELPCYPDHVFQEGLQDMRAMQLLEQLEGRDAVLGLIEEGLEQPLTFSQYPKEAEWLLELREKINRRIQRQIG